MHIIGKAVMLLLQRDISSCIIKGDRSVCTPSQRGGGCSSSCNHNDIQMMMSNEKGLVYAIYMQRGLIRKPPAKGLFYSTTTMPAVGLVYSICLPRLVPKQVPSHSQTPNLKIETVKSECGTLEFVNYAFLFFQNWELYSGEF